MVERACVVDRHHGGDQFGQAGRRAGGLRVALPQHLPRVEVDQICGLAVDGEVGLSVRGQPVVREVEVIERLGRGRLGALQAEVERRSPCPRNVDRRGHGGRDDSERDKKSQTLASGPAARTRPRAPCFWDVGCDGGNPLGLVERHSSGRRFGALGARRAVDPTQFRVLGAKRSHRGAQLGRRVLRRVDG